MSEVLSVETRDGRGTAFSRRLRAEGKIPAVLYGDGKESISLTLCSKRVAKLLRDGKAKEVVQLEGASSESVTIKDMQFDTYGTSVLHTMALNRGAHILRVHDVKEAKEVVQLFEQVQNPEKRIGMET